MINGCKTTQIYCRPNCPPGRRTKPENRVSFESRDAARAAGFRACKVCTPDDGRSGPWVSKRAAAQFTAVGRWISATVAPSVPTPSSTPP